MVVVLMAIDTLTTAAAEPENIPAITHLDARAGHHQT